MATESSLNGLSPHDQRTIAVEASVHPRSVRRYLAGEKLRSMTEDRIEKALSKLGHGALVRKAGA